MHTGPVGDLMFCLICAQTWLANQVRAKVNGKLSGKMLLLYMYTIYMHIPSTVCVSACVRVCLCVINRFKCLWHLWLNSAQHTRLQFKTNQFSCTQNHTHTHTHTHSHTHTHTCTRCCNSCYCYSYCQLPASSFSWTIYIFCRGKLIERRHAAHSQCTPNSTPPLLLFAALLSDFICCHNSLNTVASVNQRWAGRRGSE